MASFSFGARLPLGFSGIASRSKEQLRRQRRRLYSTSDTAASATSPQQGLNPVLKSSLISGSLSLAGDLLAQALAASQSNGSYTYDATRSARMASFGLCFYGPYQHWWYRLLDRGFGARTVANFASKVALNQLALAPLTITVAFGWNLALQGRAGELPGKLRQDFVPTILNGWKFWVPAATINFTAVPLQHQVLYMSVCGMLWTGYLSYSSAKKAA